MRALLWISVLLVGLWSGYWFVGKAAVDRAAVAFFETAPQQGLHATHGGLSVVGYPSRFDLTVTDPVLRDLRSGASWQAPFVQILSLSYRPWHVIAAFAPRQSIGLPGQDLTLVSEKLQASVVVTPNTALTLDRTTLVGTGLGLTSTAGWALRTDELRFGTRADPSRSNTQDIGLEILGLTPDPQLAALLPDLPQVAERLYVTGFVGFSAPLDRFAGQTRPTVTQVELKEASLTWGPLAVVAKGDLAVDNGMPEGRIDIRVQGWRAMMPLIAATGVVKPEVVPTIERMLETLASQSGEAEMLDLPLIFTGGQMRLGPLPLGPAPRF